MPKAKMLKATKVYEPQEYILPKPVRPLPKVEMTVRERIEQLQFNKQVEIMVECNTKINHLFCKTMTCEIMGYNLCCSKCMNNRNCETKCLNSIDRCNVLCDVKSAVKYTSKSYRDRVRNGI